MFFENRNTQFYFWRKTGKHRKNRKTRGKREKTKKNRYFTEIEPYLYEFDAIESRFGIYTRKTEESLFEI
jgi:hypothetical protein